jgi:hypothetical protein
MIGDPLDSFCLSLTRQSINPMDDKILKYSHGFTSPEIVSLCVGALPTGGLQCKRRQSTQGVAPSH